MILNSLTGGIDLNPVSVELAYGLERIAMCVQKVDNVFDIAWDSHKKYKDIHLESEIQYSKYNFELVDVPQQIMLFEVYEKEAKRLIEKKLFLPAYDYILKCSHTFNLLDAKGALGVSERERYVKRVRNLAKGCAMAYLDRWREIHRVEEAKTKPPLSKSKPFKRRAI